MSIADLPNNELITNKGMGYWCCSVGDDQVAPSDLPSITPADSEGTIEIGYGLIKEEGHPIIRFVLNLLFACFLAIFNVGLFFVLFGYNFTSIYFGLVEIAFIVMIIITLVKGIEELVDYVDYGNVMTITANFLMFMMAPLTSPVHFHQKPLFGRPVTYIKTDEALDEWVFETRWSMIRCIVLVIVHLIWLKYFHIMFKEMKIRRIVAREQRLQEQTYQSGYEI